MSNSDEDWDDMPVHKWYALWEVCKHFPREFFRNSFVAPLIFPSVLLLAWENPSAIIDPPTEGDG